MPLVTTNNHLILNILSKQYSIFIFYILNVLLMSNLQLLIILTNAFNNMTQLKIGSTIYIVLDLFFSLS